MAEIMLSVLRCPDAVAPGQHRAAGGEVSLGRGAECDWPLADPERVLSKKHCVLEFFAGGWQVRDLSTNGTFLNHATTPIGRDQVRPLQDGDRLRLGAYEIEVRLAEGAGQGAPSAPGWGAAPGGFGQGAAAGDPFSGHSYASSPFASPAPSQGFGNAPLPGFGAPATPAGGGFGGGLPEDFDPFGPDTPPMPDQAPSTAEAFMVPPSLPGSRPVIPDDWDLDLTPKPPRPAPVAPPQPAPRAASPAPPPASA
ncbi:type VI secretion system-associated FHA domain protein, partial [Falsiroseomonas selenitidurans]